MCHILCWNYRKFRSNLKSVRELKWCLAHSNNTSIYRLPRVSRKYFIEDIANVHPNIQDIHGEYAFEWYIQLPYRHNESY